MTAAELFDLSARYAAGADRSDPDLFASAFLPEARLRRFDPSDAAEPLTDRRGLAALSEIPGLLSRYTHTFHHLGQARYELDDDGATGEVYCVATHVTGEPVTVTVMHIRYLDSYRRVGDRWGIEDRRVMVDWTEHRQVDDR